MSCQWKEMDFCPSLGRCGQPCFEIRHWSHDCLGMLQTGAWMRISQIHLQGPLHTGKLNICFRSTMTLFSYVLCISINPLTMGNGVIPFYRLQGFWSHKVNLAVIMVHIFLWITEEEKNMLVIFSLLGVCVYWTITFYLWGAFNENWHGHCHIQYICINLLTNCFFKQPLFPIMGAVIIFLKVPFPYVKSINN